MAVSSSVGREMQQQAEDWKLQLLTSKSICNGKRATKVKSACAAVWIGNGWWWGLSRIQIWIEDARLVLGDGGSQISPGIVARGLSSLYKEITDTVRKEPATITAVFPSPNGVKSIIVQV